MPLSGPVSGEAKLVMTARHTSCCKILLLLEDVHLSLFSASKFLQWDMQLCNLGTLYEFAVRSETLRNSPINLLSACSPSESSQPGHWRLSCLWFQAFWICSVCCQLLALGCFDSLNCYLQIGICRWEVSEGTTAVQRDWQPANLRLVYSRLSNDSSVVLAMIPYDVFLVPSPEQAFFGAAPPGCSLDTRDWTVVSHDPVVSEDRIVRLEEEFRDFKAGAGKDAVYLGKPEVVNLASQVLLFAVGEQPCASSNASYFTNLSKQNDTSLSSFATDLGIMSASSFARLADEVITRRARRNKTLHYADWDSLEAAVAKHLEFVSRHPALRSECRKECVVLDSFHLIKQNFA